MNHRNDRRAGESAPIDAGAAALLAELRLGTRFGERSRFELLESLGAGGMGVVFLVKDWELDRLAAAKFIRPDIGLDLEQTRGHLKAEAQAAAKLSHENIVSVFDIGVWDEIPYLLMEFLRGVPLDDMLRETPPSPQRATEIMVQIARGLEHAHRHGVTHLDLKPSNVLVLASGRAKIVDFGLARVHRAQTATLGSSMDGNGQDSGERPLIGTPLYMAPEQWYGATPDERTDIWSAGVVFFELLTGRRPFEGADLREIRARVTSARPAPGLRASVDAPEIAELVLSRALEKDPSLRMQNATELLEGVERIRAAYLQSSPSSRTAVSSERRPITVLACKLSDELAAYGEGQEGDDHGDAERRLLDSVANALGKFDGFMVGPVGHELLAAFGYPLGHEDDAQRAVLAGLLIVMAMREQNLHVRVGIDSGMVVVEERGVGHPSLRGPPPFVARCISDRADTVVVSHSTLRLVRGRFSMVPLGERRIEGVAKPIETHEVVAEADGSSRFEQAPAAGTVPLIGRDKHLATLREHWSNARHGHGGFVFITADAGMGKSRLAMAFKDIVMADGDRVWMNCQCWPQASNSAFQPIIDVVRRSMGIARDDAPAAKVSSIEAALAGYGLTALLPMLASLLSVEHNSDVSDSFGSETPAERKRQTIDGLIAILNAMSARAPVVFLIEDLHWVDPSTLEFLDALSGRAMAMRVLVLLTARPEFPHSFRGSPRPFSRLAANTSTQAPSAVRAGFSNIPRESGAPWRPTLDDSELSSATGTSIHEIVLEPLAEGAMAALVDSICGDARIAPTLIQQVIGKADGVPLFVEEMTRMLLDAAATGDGLERGPTVGVPATLQELLRARLDRLPGIGKEVAQVAGAIGRGFSYRTMCQVADLDPNNVSYGLNRLVMSGVLVSRGTMPDAQYQFRHALLLDAAYQSLPKAQRQKLHGRIAQVSGDELEPEVLAHHCSEAGDNDRAIALWEKAARAAAARSANVEAIHHFNDALHFLRALPESVDRNQRELALQLALGAPLMIVKGYAAPEVEQTYARARELARSKLDPSELFAATQGLWQYCMVRGDLPASRELGEQLLSLAQGPIESKAARVLARRALATSVFGQGDFLQSVEHAKRGLAEYSFSEHRMLALRTGHDPAVAHMCYMGWALWILGYPDAAFARVSEGVALSERLNHSHTLAYAIGFETLLRNLLGDFRTAKQRAMTGNAIARDHKFALWLAWGMMQLGVAECGLGEFDTGIAKFRKGLEGWLQTGARAGMTCFLIGLSEACMRAGLLSAATEKLDEACAMVKQNDEHFYEAELCRMRGELLLASNPSNVDRADAYFAEGLRIAKQQSARSWELRLALSRYRTLARHGRGNDAHTELRRVYESFTEGRETKDLMEAQSWLANTE